MSPFCGNISSNLITYGDYINEHTHTHTHTLSLSILTVLPGGPGLASTRMSPFWILLELRVMEVVVITAAIIRAKLQ